MGTAGVSTLSLQQVLFFSISELQSSPLSLIYVCERIPDSESLIEKKS